MTDRQKSFFDDDFEQDQKAKRGTPPVRDPNAVPADVPRLRGQNAQILQRLEQGRASNVELAKISLKYTSRISDLRKAGYVVVCHRDNGGLSWYELKEI